MRLLMSFTFCSEAAGFSMDANGMITGTLPAGETTLTVGISALGQYHNFVRLGDADDPLSAAVVPLIDLARLKPETRDFMNPARWHQNSSGKQTFHFNAEENALEVRTDFRNKRNPADNNWSFPEFRFRPEEKKGKPCPSKPSNKTERKRHCPRQ